MGVIERAAPLLKFLVGIRDEVVGLAVGALSRLARKEVRTVVDELGERVTGLEAQPAAQALLDLDDQAVVRRVDVIGPVVEPGVERVRARVRKRRIVAHAVIPVQVHQDRQVPAERSLIIRAHHEIAEELALHAEVEIVHRAVLQVVLHRADRDAPRGPGQRVRHIGRRRARRVCEEKRVAGRQVPTDQAVERRVPGAV